LGLAPESSIITFISSMQKLFIVGSIALLLSACAAPARFGYVKDGATASQGTDALSECQYQIRLNKTVAAEQNELLKLCMQGKGFRLKRVN
jgi:outer membrane biogenesis lipoprotein LolB